jgi:hypothetical protein
VSRSSSDSVADDIGAHVGVSTFSTELIPARKICRVMVRVACIASVLLLSCAPSLSGNPTDRKDALRVAVVDVRAPPSRVARALEAMEVAAATNSRIQLIRANERGMTWELMSSAQQLDAASLTSLVEADAYVAVDVEEVRLTMDRVYVSFDREYRYQMTGEAHLGVRVALPDGRIAVARRLDGRVEGQDPYVAARLPLPTNDLPEQALDVALMRFIEDFGPL